MPFEGSFAGSGPILPGEPASSLPLPGLVPGPPDGCPPSTYVTISLGPTCRPHPQTPTPQRGKDKSAVPRDPFETFPC